MVYEYIESCQPELERKAKYSKKEAKEVISILIDFGYCKETLEIPEKIITTGQLENWKKSMIDKKLSAMRVSNKKGSDKRRG